MDLSYVRACALDDVPDEGALRVEIDDADIAVVRSQGQVHAIEDYCSHADVPLSEGEVYDGKIECWLHGSCFDLASGKAICLPATDPIVVYRTRIEGGDVYVSLAEEP
jgi:3-phenylpropionate/trans-cinnamate dioxygenase ferredoxin subunit